MRLGTVKWMRCGTSLRCQGNKKGDIIQLNLTSSLFPATKLTVVISAFECPAMQAFSIRFAARYKRESFPCGSGNVVEGRVRA